MSRIDVTLTDDNGDIVMFALIDPRFDDGSMWRQLPGSGPLTVTEMMHRIMMGELLDEGLLFSVIEGHQDETCHPPHWR